ncbi:MAG: CRP/FNR family cyclic AMP-dependent transcriptional regulator [Myxococcota bacterium]|jgi:CRP/FNR family cyclic AMP-dependent transcriptional regulator
MESSEHDSSAPALSTTQHTRELCLQTIQETDWGRGLDESVLVLMLDYVQSYRVAEGGIIFSAGDPGSFMAFIVSGTVRAFIGDQTIAVLGPGNSFGEMALVDDEPRSASIQALEETDILVLTALDFEGLLDERPDTASRILIQVSRVLSQRVRYLNQRLYEAG